MFEIEDVTPPDPKRAANPESRASPATAQAARPGVPVEPRRLIWEIVRRKRWIWGSTALGAALGVGLALKYAPREFAVTSLLTWNAASAHSDGRDPLRELHTMVDSVKTPAVLLEVRSKLALSVSLEGLARQIEVVSDDKSNMISVTAVAASAPAALALGQTTLEVFQKQRVVSEKQRREEIARTLGTRLDTARQSLADIRQQEQLFLKEEHVTDLPSELQQAIADYARYVQEEVAAGADVAAEQARLDSLTASLHNRAPTVVLSEKTVRPDGAKLADIESELAGLRGGGLSEDHPRIKMLEAQAKGLRAHGSESWANSVVTERSSGRNPEIGNYQARIIESNAAREGAAGREKALARLAADANARVERLRIVERRGADLARSLAAAEAHVADLDALHFQALDAAHMPVTGLSLLEAPALPSTPRRSLRKLYATFGVLLGAALGFFMILAWSLRGLHVHTSTELAFWGNGPVLASSQWPRRELLPDLAEELAAQSVGTTGSALVVAAGPIELELLRTLASAAGWPGCDESAAAEAPIRVWLQPAAGQSVRKAVRNAARVIVVVNAGAHSLLSISEFAMRIGAQSQLGYVLLNVTDELVVLPERVGDVRAFWHPASEAPRLRMVGRI
jgi:uncharacterized protein involved in exopolysaccharide biosynthesis